MYSVSTDGDLEGCCGVMEICGFDSDDYGDVCGATFAELLSNICAENKGYMYHIHFKKKKKYDGKFEKSSEWNGLRLLVRKIPGVVHMGTFVNPNTGNKIDSYSWVNK